MCFIKELSVNEYIVLILIMTIVMTTMMTMAVMTVGMPNSQQISCCNSSGLYFLGCPDDKFGLECEKQCACNMNKTIR